MRSSDGIRSAAQGRWVSFVRDTSIPGMEITMTVIKNERGYQATAEDLYRLLDVQPGKLPVEGMPERRIQGVRVYVRPLSPNPSARRNFQGLRVMAICDGCERHLAVGRMHQHKCKPIMEVDWCCSDCYDTWADPKGNKRPCPRCKGTNTYWLDYSDTRDPYLSEPSTQDGMEHKFIASTENPIYCKECGCSETDHRL